MFRSQSLKYSDEDSSKNNKSSSPEHLGELPDLYPKQKGESGSINDEYKPLSDHVFYVQGPMGKGLQIEERGTHIAFCAGTGILVYLDIVAHLLLRNTRHLLDPEPFFNESGKGAMLQQFDKKPYEFLDKDFKFILYASFMNRQQSIGLELCESLLKVNEALGLDNF